MELRGNKFVGEKVDFKVLYYEHKKSENTNDVYHLPTKGETDKICENCFFSTDEDKRPINCFSKKAKELFQIDPEQEMPKIIDGKQVGHYCPEWLYWKVL